MSWFNRYFDNDRIRLRRLLMEYERSLDQAKADPTPEHIDRIADIGFEIGTTMKEQLHEVILTR